MSQDAMCADGRMSSSSVAGAGGNSAVGGVREGRGAATPRPPLLNLQCRPRASCRNCVLLTNPRLYARCLGVLIRHGVCTPNRPCVVAADDGRVRE